MATSLPASACRWCRCPWRRIWDGTAATPTSAARARPFPPAARQAALFAAPRFLSPPPAASARSPATRVLSIEERYPSREDFLQQVEAAARKLVADGYLLEEDVASLVAQAAEHFEAMAGSLAEVQPVAD